MYELIDGRTEDSPDVCVNGSQIPPMNVSLGEHSVGTGVSLFKVLVMTKEEVIVKEWS